MLGCIVDDIHTRRRRRKKQISPWDCIHSNCFFNWNMQSQDDIIIILFFFLFSINSQLDSYVNTLMHMNLWFCWWWWLFFSSHNVCQKIKFAIPIEIERWNELVLNVNHFRLHTVCIVVCTFDKYLFSLTWVGWFFSFLKNLFMVCFAASSSALISIGHCIALPYITSSINYNTYFSFFATEFLYIYIS